MADEAPKSTSKIRNLKSEKFSSRLRHPATSSDEGTDILSVGEGGRLACRADRQDARRPHSRDGRAPFPNENRRNR